jgi:Bacterial PH domain
MLRAGKLRAKRDFVNLSQDELRPGVPHIRTVEDTADFENAPVRSYGARWQLFLPAVAVGVVYLGAWAYLYSTGMRHTAIARLLLIVLTVGVPLITAHAFLRRQTIRIQVLSKGIRYHPGWPRDLPVDLPYDLIERIKVKKSLVSWLFNTGTLVIDLTTGERVAIADLYRPELVRGAIESSMDSAPVG